MIALKVYGDLKQTGKLTSKSSDLRGQTAGVMGAEWSQLFDPAVGAPDFKSLPLPAGTPAMTLEGFTDSREGAVWKRTFRMVESKLGSGSEWSGFPVRDRNNAIHTLAVTLEDLPISLHPDIDYLIDEYAGVTQADGTVEFARTYVPVASKEDGGLTGGEGETTNPMWGVRTYKSVTVVFSKKWVWTGSKDQPWPNWWATVGMIEFKPPGSPEVSNRDWLYLGLTSRQTGNHHEIDESWLLSPPGGWPTMVYSSKALKLLSAESDDGKGG